MTHGPVSLLDLGRRVAEGEIVANLGGGYTAYGWTHVLRGPRGNVPLRVFIGRSTFKFTARRNLDRWIQAWEHAEANGVNPCRT